MTTDPEGRITGWNPGARILLGWEPGEIVGQDLRLIFTPEDRRADVLEQDISMALAAGRAQTERWHVRKDGHRFWTKDQLMPLGPGGAQGFLLVVHDRTAEHEAAQAVAVANRRATDILECISDAFLALDRTYRILFQNRAGERLNRRPREEISGKTVWEVWPALLGGPQEIAYQRAMTERVPVTLEDHYQDDVHDLWLEVQVEPTPEGIGIFYRDITPRKRAEEERQRLLERLRIAIRTAGTVVFNQDRDLRYTWILNPALGYQAEAVLGTADADLFERAEDAAALTAIKRRVLESGQGERHEIRVRQDGAEHHYDLIVEPDRDAGGAVIGVIGAATDITAHVATRQALRLKEEHLRFALAAAQAGTWEWDVVTGALTWSDEVYRHWGLDPAHDTPTHDTWLARIHPEDRPRVVQVVCDTFAARREAYAMEARSVQTDTGVRWIFGLGRAVYDADGQPLRLLGISLDITGRKRMEEALRAAKEEAERANRAKSRFLAAASHDLRQPLQSLFLFAHVLGRHVHGSAGQEALTALGRGLDALKSLLDSLLDVSRLDAGIVTPKIEPFAVQQLLLQAATTFGAVARAKGLDFHIGPCSAVVRSDPVLLGRMLSNLVENAVRYTDTGRVSVTCRRADGLLRIDVRDTGVGIPREHTNRIWEEFHQVGNLERDRAQGLGLGLAIVQRLSNLLGHAVAVRSTPKKGSVFSVTVPLAQEELHHPVRPTVRITGNGRLAVAVDDDGLVLESLRAILQDWGFDVLAAGSADEACDALGHTARKPAVIVADYRLRDGRTGIEAVQRIRDLCGVRIPGIILTGEMTAESHRQADLHGLGLVHKPVTPNDLGGAFERVHMAEGQRDQERE
ncbi:PAS domain S-box-containing protein [Azospirillum canadense]|nr:PAS domain S-box-containing protein [Azospirillum canadense]